MKFAVAKEHKIFFEEKGWIEFEDLWKVDKIQTLESEIQDVLLHRQGFKRDLWRESDFIRKLVCQRGLGEVIYQLTGERPIRLANDQLIDPSFLKKSASLNEISSIRGLLCGLMISLEGEEQLSGDEFRFPTRFGHTVIFHPDLILDWQNVTQKYYLVVFSTGKGLYKRNVNDPLSGFWIQLGYSSGDLLREKLNPTIFR